MRSYKDNLGSLLQPTVTNDVAGFQSIHDWHLHIHQNHVECLSGLDPVNGFLAIHSHLHILNSNATQDAFEDFLQGQIKKKKFNTEDEKDCRLLIKAR